MYFQIVGIIFAIAGINAAPSVTFKNHTTIFSTNNYNTRIINGDRAVRGQFPWQVALVLDNTYFCGGSLIDYSGWILTAGHCTYEHSFGDAIIGQIDRSVIINSLYSIKSMYVHPYYNPSTVANDIGLVKLYKKVSPTPAIKTIKISKDFAYPLEDVVVTGWGKTDDSPSSQISLYLNYINLTVVSNTECKKVYGEIVNAGMVCAMGDNRKSTCSGDSGGPLIDYYEDLQVGIVSYVSAKGCTLGQPMGFTRVGSYMAWIRFITKLQL